MTAQTARRPHRSAETAAKLREEIDWLRSFGWTKERVAERLGVTVSCIEKHLREHP